MQALVDSARRKESVLIAGLDPAPGLVPSEIGDQSLPESRAAYEFCRGVLEAVEPYVAAVKLQSAYFERLGAPGVEVYAELIKDATNLGLPTIADVKRGDIGPVAAAYAEAHLSVFGATCVTVNPYMGSDAVLPFLEEARRLDRGGGVFALVATSNPSAPTLQDLTDPPLYELAAKLVADLGEESGGQLDAGAVVGATQPEVGRRVRELLPDSLFLSPGYGAQGGGASEVRSLLDRRGGGVLVNSSRGILYAYEGSGTGYREAAREAARKARDELEAVGVQAWRRDVF